jgi:hypothetical protein
MAGRKKDNRAAEEVELCLIKWECLRRNPQYQLDYDEYQRNPDSLVGDQIREKYGLNKQVPIPDPKKEPKNEPGMPYMPFLDRGVVDWSGAPFGGKDIKPNEILLRIDLRKPKKDLLVDIEFQLDVGRKRCGIRSFSRRQINLYREYLEVWDLKEGGNTFVSIAAEKGNVEVKAIQYRYNCAKKLIQEGFKEI